MSQTLLIEAVRRGERITTEHSLHAKADGTHCSGRGWNHRPRTIACDNVHDVVECSLCGDQSVVSCNFDEDMS